MYTVKSNIQQWIKLISFYKKCFEKEIIKMILLRLVIVRIKINMQSIGSGKCFGINIILQFDCISANKRLYSGNGKNMSNIIIIDYFKFYFDAIKSCKTNIFERDAKVQNFSLVQRIFCEEIQVRCKCSFGRRSEV